MIVDAELTSKPWAKVEVSAHGQKFVILSDKIVDHGMQGVRPISEDEIALRLAHERELDKGRATYESQKSYYCLWTSANGVVVDAIKPHHKAFFKWLGCVWH
jgi:hypothetical protein